MCVDVRMSDSECEFVSSQVSKMDYNDTIGSQFGGDIVDGDVGSAVNVVSLEANCSDSCVGFEETSDRMNNMRKLYDDVFIEDISSDEEMDKL